MLFNTIDFAIFLPIVFLLYWFVFKRNLFLQNLFVVIASYVFYGWWDWRFLGLILFSSLTDYTIGIFLGKQNNQKKRKTLLIISLVINLGFLGFFKYYNFFLDSFISAFSLFGCNIHGHSLKIILPVGISFYTFQTLSYTIDVYRKKLEPTKNLMAFLAFVSFFPQLVAGPIERATNLLPQFQKKRTFDYTKAVDGLRQMLWGLFKKMVIADNCAVIVNNVFANYETLNGSQLLIGAIFFAFQIYGDFSGYSDIAIGCSKLFGINLMRNFNFPYFSRDIAEFWRRWHISLTTWFRDYIYFPLGGSRVSKWKVVRNTFIIFIVSGFWHGANWTFIAWGVYHALLFLPLILLGKNRKYTNTVAEGRIFPKPKECMQMALTFSLVLIGWVIFRSESIGMAFQYLGGMLQVNTFRAIYLIFEYDVTWFCLIMIAFEWFGRNNQYALEKFGLKWWRPLRYIVYYAIIILILYFAGAEQQFIYFQF